MRWFHPEDVVLKEARKQNMAMVLIISQSAARPLFRPAKIYTINALACGWQRQKYVTSLNFALREVQKKPIKPEELDKDRLNGSLQWSPTLSLRYRKGRGFYQFRSQRLPWQVRPSQTNLVSGLTAIDKTYDNSWNKKSTLFGYKGVHIKYNYMMVKDSAAGQSPL